MDSVKRIKKQYDSILKTDPSIFVTSDAYLKFIGTGSSEIRKEIVELTADLQHKGILKAAFAVGAGILGYFTEYLPLKIGLFAAAGGSAIAADMEFRSCYELDQLLELLDRRGYLR
ncbi:unnamed protein product [Adineta steineri]|uniref:Uncharacterized protein n=1 Tax=Adineta steineri TaxID=433720 RepID=A0A815A039_9BILA|nr:unnamed protein product [Adineta steineri]CAF1302241.1 unnamed protein product [Adineta steineri]CAF3556307.1 unnamed protein product [Adineta steineri]CAF3623291.1 unnamed protein product [Adineta steineri]